MAFPIYFPKRRIERGDTAAVLAAANEVLLTKEWCIETDTGRIKIGDGSTAYNSLPYKTDAAPCFTYTSDTNTPADSDPGAGLFRWNNGTQASATFLYFDDVTSDTATDLSTYFGSLGASGFLHIVNAGNEKQWQVWKWSSVTDGTGYWKFAVALQASSGSFANGVAVRVVFVGGGGGTWGSITGTLSAQTDLQAALDAKLDDSQLDTDTTLAANSDTKIASQKAVKAYVAASVAGLLDLKGGTSCSGNPNYPAALKGDAYYVTSAGKIGGASGKSVDIGDVFVASADNAGGTEASVGTSWFVLEHNLAGALIASNNLSDLTNVVTARSNLGVTSPDGGILIQGGSIASTSALLAGFVVDAIVPAGYTLAGGWDLLVYPSGSLTLDIRKGTFPTYPAVTSIVAAAPPSVTAASSNSSATYTGWTTSIAREDTLRAIVTSVSGVKWFGLLLKGTKV